MYYFGKYSLGISSYAREYSCNIWYPSSTWTLGNIVDKCGGFKTEADALTWAKSAIEKHREAIRSLNETTKS